MTQIDSILPSGFNLELFPNRTSAASVLQRRSKKPSQINIDLWICAWDRFRTESFNQIPPPTCFKESDKLAPEKRESYRAIYRQNAVLHFLPYFEKIEPLVTGKRLKTVRAAIDLLRFWKRRIPNDCPKKLPENNANKIILEKASTPPAILLPMPPTNLSTHTHEISPSDPCLKNTQDAFQPESKSDSEGFTSEDWDILGSAYPSPDTSSCTDEN